jgi:serine/threonine protein kinase
LISRIKLVLIGSFLKKFGSKKHEKSAQISVFFDTLCINLETSSRDRCTFYLVFAFYEHDLAGLLSNPNVLLKLNEIKTLMKHLLNGLYKIHSSNILHRDMKAANILISKEGVLKLGDFGLARPLFKKLPGNICCFSSYVDYALSKIIFYKKKLGYNSLKFRDVNEHFMRESL